MQGGEEEGQFGGGLRLRRSLALDAEQVVAETLVEDAVAAQDAVAQRRRRRLPRDLQTLRVERDAGDVARRRFGHVLQRFHRQRRTGRPRSLAVDGLDVHHVVRVGSHLYKKKKNSVQNFIYSSFLNSFMEENHSNTMIQ